MKWKGKAKIDNLPEILNTMENFFTSYPLGKKELTQLKIALEELFVNVVYYAYPNREGDLEIYFEIDNFAHEIKIQLKDQGIPYNPLEKKDPNTKMSSEERRIGGLGIYMVKQLVDKIYYSYKDQRNILTLVKKFGTRGEFYENTGRTNNRRL